MVDEAIDPADDDVVQQIMAFVEQAQQTPLVDRRTGEVYRDEKGNILHEEHFFIEWLDGLQAGSWSLPERIPRAVLQEFAKSSGIVFRRCEDCLMGLPQRMGGWTICPVCAGTRISWKKLSGPPWDPAHIYTPFPETLPGAGGKGSGRRRG